MNNIILEQLCLKLQIGWLHTILKNDGITIYFRQACKPMYGFNFWFNSIKIISFIITKESLKTNVEINLNYLIDSELKHS